MVATQKLETANQSRAVLMVAAPVWLWSDNPGERRESQRRPARTAGAVREAAATQGGAGEDQEARRSDEGAHNRRINGHRRRPLLPGTDAKFHGIRCLRENFTQIFT